MTGTRGNSGSTQDAGTIALPLSLSLPSLAGIGEKAAEISSNGLKVMASVPLMTLAFVLTPTTLNAPASVFNHNPSIILSAKPTPEKNPGEFKRLPGNQGWVNKNTGKIYKKSHTSHENPGNVGTQWKVWPKGTSDFGSNSKKTGQRKTLDGEGNVIGN